MMSELITKPPSHPSKKSNGLIPFPFMPLYRWSLILSEGNCADEAKHVKVAQKFRKRGKIKENENETANATAMRK